MLNQLPLVLARKEPIRYTIKYNIQPNDLPLQLCPLFRKKVKSMRKCVRKRVCSQVCQPSYACLLSKCNTYLLLCIKGNNMIHLLQISVPNSFPLVSSQLRQSTLNTGFWYEDEESSFWGYPWTSCCCPLNTS